MIFFVCDQCGNRAKVESDGSVSATVQCHCVANNHSQAWLLLMIQMKTEEEIDLYSERIDKRREIKRCLSEINRLNEHIKELELELA